MRNRIVGAITATVIASAALVACSPANQNDSDVKITDQKSSSTPSFEKSPTPSGSEAPMESSETPAAS